jgi:hypothetical protein
MSSSGIPLYASTYSPAELKEEFDKLRPQLAEDKNVVKCGGYYNLQQLSGNPKEELVSAIVDGLKASKSKVKVSSDQDEKIEALSTLLFAHGKGFEADLVDGEWYEVLSRQGKKSPKFQKLVEKGEKGWSPNTFDISTMTFDGGAKVLKKGKVYSKVKYSPTSKAYSKTSDGKIVLRRLDCDIVKATFKWWKLPTISLGFLKKKGGYLDFVYMDKDIRVTRGSRGGLFVHFRPDFLKAQLTQERNRMLKS